MGQLTHKCLEHQDVLLICIFQTIVCVLCLFSVVSLAIQRNCQTCKHDNTSMRWLAISHQAGLIKTCFWGLHQTNTETLNEVATNNTANFKYIAAIFAGAVCVKHAMKSLQRCIIFPGPHPYNIFPFQLFTPSPHPLPQ